MVCAVCARSARKYLQYYLKMYYLNNICFVCLQHNRDLQTVTNLAPDNKIFAQVTYALPELMGLDSEIPVYICSRCHTTLRSFFTFKKKCLKNYSRLKNYIKILKGTNYTPKKRFSELQIRVINSEKKQQKRQETDINLNIKDSLLPPSGTEENICNELKMKVSNNKQQMKKKEEGKEDASWNEQNDLKFDVESIGINEDSMAPETGTTGKFYQRIVKRESLSDAEQDGSLSSTRKDIKLLNKNGTTLSSPTKNNEFRCTVCNKTFPQKYNLKRHLKHFHLGIKEFECSICNKKFLQKTYLEAHIKYHLGIRNFACSICNKKYIKKSHLELHLRSHADIRNFECSVCDKKFLQKFALNRHMKIHLGIKDFECSTCNKKFISKDALKQHVKIHLDIKDFECSFCNKKFAEKSKLKRHMKCHLHIKNVQISQM